MPRTLGALLAQDDLALTPLVDGDPAALIRWVHATEQPHPAAYLHGGEVVLTDGLWQSSIDAREYVEHLARADVCAIGFGLVEGGGPPPAPLVDACRQVGVPLFAVPVQVPFLAVSEWFVDQVLAEREHALRRDLHRHDELLLVLEQGRGVSGIIECIERMIDLPVAMVDDAGAVVAGRYPVPRAIGQLLKETGGSAHRAQTVEGWALSRVWTGSGGDTYGLCCQEPPGGLAMDDRAALRMAEVYLGRELAHENALREAHRRYSVELFAMLDAGATDQAAARLRELGLDPHRPIVAMVCDTAATESGIRALEKELAARGLPALVAPRAGYATALVQWTRPVRDLAPLASALVEAVGPDALLGVGEVSPGARHLPAAIESARSACRFAGMHQERAYITAPEMGSLNTLLGLQDPAVLVAFRNSVLKGLIEHDARTGGELASTLTAFLVLGGRWKRAADHLHVHVNTLRQRLAKVEALTGRDLDSTEDRLVLYLALQPFGPDDDPPAMSR